jgi:hypothetical protein
MRVRETETVEVIKKETHVLKDDVTCDLCGLRAKAHAARPDVPADIGGGIGLADTGANWTDGRGRYSSYKYDIITVQRAEVVSSTEDDGGWASVTEFHVCPACWEKMTAFIGLFRGSTGYGRRESW